MTTNNLIPIAAVGGAALLFLRSRNTTARPIAPEPGPPQQTQAISSPTTSAGVTSALGRSSPTNITPATEGVQPGGAGLAGTPVMRARESTAHVSMFDTRHTSGEVGRQLPVTLNQTQYITRDRAGQAYRLTARGVSQGIRAVVWEFESIDIESKSISASGASVATAVKLDKGGRFVVLPWDVKPIDPVLGVSSTNARWTQFDWWAANQKAFTQQELQRQATAQAHPGNEIGGFDLIPTPGIGIVSSLPGILGDAVGGLRKLF